MQHEERRFIFSDLRVLDLATVLAGPAVASFFGELGAEVIKLESPNGDVTRTWFGKEEERNSTSAYFQSVNHEKKVLVLDLTTQRSELEKWLNWADVVITNFKAGDNDKFGLSSEQIWKINDKAIIGRITGFEYQTHRVAYDVVIQAETGYMNLNREKGGLPNKMPVALMDVLAAHHLKEGVLCALLQREKTGKGTEISVSLEMAGITSLMNQASSFLKTGREPEPQGSLHPQIAPYGEIIAFEDHVEIVLAIGSQAQFIGLCETLNRMELIEDERYMNNAQRVHNRVTLLDSLRSAAQQLNSEKCLELLQKKHVPYGRINTIGQVIHSQAGQASLTTSRQIDNDQPYIQSVAFQWLPFK